MTAGYSWIQIEEIKKTDRVPYLTSERDLATGLAQNHMVETAIEDID